MQYAMLLAVLIGVTTLSGCNHGSALTAPTTTLAAPQSGQPVTVHGVIRAGALPGCNMVQADDGRHYLLVDTTDPPLNVPVTVTGIVDTSLVSYCNDGRALHVQRISPR